MEIVLSGVEITLNEVQTSNEWVRGILNLTNKDVGHQFPTYVTPRVVMEAVQLDGLKNHIPETRYEQLIARKVSVDLARELFDTRLAPGQMASLDYQAPLHPKAKSILFRIQVEPDSFYRDFYRAKLNNGSSNKGAEFLRLALRNAETSVFTLFRKEIPLNKNRGSQPDS